MVSWFIGKWNLPCSLSRYSCFTHATQLVLPQLASLDGDRRNVLCDEQTDDESRNHFVGSLNVDVAVTSPPIATVGLNEVFPPIAYAWLCFARIIKESAETKSS